MAAPPGRTVGGAHVPDHHDERRDEVVNKAMSVRQPVKAVTFDAYNTLFDFASDALPTLRAIMPGAVHHRLGDVWETMNRVITSLFSGFVGKQRGEFDTFVTLSEIHRACFVAVRDRFLPTLDVEAATEGWNRYIARVPLYDDALPAVEWAAKRFPTAIVSDIDTWMLAENPALPRLPLAGYVTSEQDRSYKAMADCTMFQRAAEILACEPEGILHVGDSPADVLSARRAGARVVWLNRDGYDSLDGAPEPDRVIHALAELPAVVTTMTERRP